MEDEEKKTAALKMMKEQRDIYIKLSPNAQFTNADYKSQKKNCKALPALPEKVCKEVIKAYK